MTNSYQPHLLASEPTTEQELRALVAGTRNAPAEYSIAVEAIVFDNELNWILMQRGGRARDEVGKLEGIGGRLESDPDLRSGLRREIAEEIGTKATIEIVDFLEVKWDVVTKRRGTERTKTNWIIASYLCKLVGGELLIVEPEKCVGFVRVPNLCVDEDRLSSSTRISLETLRDSWQIVSRRLRIG